ncbi:hypothetical protein [Bradyrhizobium sp. AZCC 1578]|uniref:hypothetical protein n=1 Tax=Bradyrhizobium sp. AZCC 1578 TaxID=3117027 RepID=UPI002FEFE5CB
MTETATGYVWLGLAPILAGLILFAWNFIEAQAQIYEKLAISHRAEVSELQARLARFDEPTPNYEAWRHVNELKVKQAAFLWCEIEPRISQTPKVTAWANALEAAIKKGELGFVPKLSQYGSEAAQYIEQQKGAWSETIVTRDQLRSFAQAHGYDPIFLREA